MKLFKNNLIILKNGSRAKKQFVDLFINKLTFTILMLLYSKGLIFGYMYITRYKIRVFLKYFNNKGLLENIFLPDVRFQFYKYEEISKLYLFGYNFSYFFCFTTSKGVFFSMDSLFLKYKIGGILLFIIY